VERSNTGWGLAGLTIAGLGLGGVLAAAVALAALQRSLPEEEEEPTPMFYIGQRVSVGGGDYETIQSIEWRENQIWLDGHTYLPQWWYFTGVGEPPYWWPETYLRQFN